LKSRRKASTVAATANARPIRLIATARPVFPAFAAADSSELAPGSAERARGAPAALGLGTAAGCAAGPGAMHAHTTSAAMRRPGRSSFILPPCLSLGLLGEGVHLHGRHLPAG